MKLAAWMVLRDDKYYVDMAIKSILPYVEGIYILDNGSTDGSIEVVESFKEDKIYLEKIKLDCTRPEPDSGRDSSITHPYWTYDESRDGNSLEAETRNRCMNQCVQLFQPDWLIQIDADEVFTPLFFKKLSEIDLKQIQAIRHSTDRFISRNRLAISKSEYPSWGKFYDPHIRSWDPRAGIIWEKPSPGNSHVRAWLPGGKSPKSINIDGVMHIHLHRTFGPKSEIFWEVNKQPGIPYDPRVNKERFQWAYNNSVPTDFDWSGLEFVIKRWEEWGIW